MEFYTIGVYNSTETDFFQKLAENQIDTFCDIRQRRGVRGAKYSFVNSKKLQLKLKELNINYKHVLDLAPTSEIREFQKKADIFNKQLKIDRKELGEVFKAEYKQRILQKFQFPEFINNLEKDKAERIVLFCVEEYPKACHRSIVTEKLEVDFKINTIHL